VGKVKGSEDAVEMPVGLGGGAGVNSGKARKRKKDSAK
jgi:hypothetical protein